MRAIAASGRAVRSLSQAIRNAGRSLRSTPKAAAAIILILALGMSAATVTFSVVDAVVLRPLPFEDDDELVLVGLRSPANAPSTLGPLGVEQYRALRDRAGTLHPLAAVVHADRMALNVDGVLEPLVSVQATASLFQTLRVQPLLGQPFSAVNETEGKDQVALISYGLWQRRFGGDAAVVGRSLPVTRTRVLSGVSTNRFITIVGVMPRNFAYPLSMNPSPDIWTPYVPTGRETVANADGRMVVSFADTVSVIGRVTPESSLMQAQDEARTIVASVDEAGRGGSQPPVVHVVPLKDRLIGRVRGWMTLALAAVVVVMLIACVNVANLQLVRAMRRDREVAIRFSLGAQRSEVIASLLVEGLLMSLAAAGVALVVAVWGIQVAKTALPAELFRVAEIGLDGRVFTATVAAATVTGILFGLVPAWHASRADLLVLANHGMGVFGVARQRWRTTFVVAEVAFVSALLVCAILIISSYIRVTSFDLGFDRSRLLVVTGDTGVDTTNTALTLQRLEGVAGVAAVGAVSSASPPLVMHGFRTGGSTIMPLRASEASLSAAFVSAELRQVSDGYFAAAGITVVSGGVFNAGTDATRETAIVLDEKAARELFGQEDAIGAHVNDLRARNTRHTVVGVVRHVSLDGPEREAMPQVYVPIGSGHAGPVAGVRFVEFVVRTTRPPTNVVPAIRAAMPGATTSEGPPLQVRLVEDAFRNITAERRFNAGLMSIFGALAILIGAAGVYSVMASTIAQQAREFSIRVALGAAPGRIVKDVLVGACGYLAVGLAVGLGAGWWASRSMEFLLFDIAPTDVSTYGIVAVVLMTVGVSAALFPAVDAARADPGALLRSE